MKPLYVKIDTSNYGSLEVKILHEKNYIYHGQVKRDTEIKHGRGCEIHTFGAIYDQYYFNDQRHGPRLAILPNGDYGIAEYKHGFMESQIGYYASGARLGKSLKKQTTTSKAK